ncbi:discoidin domain-containing protein [Lysinibacillus macroides]|uniref:F5/8 type C domain-containing protein n=1 Tax=Lysinibacillus macroides TaxID=33935 RepID=A0A0M9DLF4_9BACI|nr:discoidin domain-containing protein [Lysinibacillus macroides]KOY83013.1 hypothetical protein ADM90_06805 [Lysinibacillus macroides]QPR70135.1 discoidin domain-containing protein [Lysinibacillus macroides]
MAGNITWYEINMTSNTSPSPYVASASSLHNSGSTAWGAFNGLPSGQWVTPDNVGVGSWIQIYLGEETKVNWIQINPRNDTYFYQNPYKFKIQYSMNGADWSDSEIIVSHKFTSINDGFKTKLESTIKGKYFRLYVTELFLGNHNISIGEIIYGYENSDRMIIKSPMTNKHYSLAENTLIHLPNSSPKNMILHGIEQGKEIQLDVPFTKHNYVNALPIANVKGKVFTQDIGRINTLNTKEVKESDFKLLYTWYETKMTSNNTPSPLTVNANSEFNTDQQAWRAFNGDVYGLPWATVNNAHNNSWIQIDFGTIRKINIVQLTPRNAPNINQTPKDFYIQTSKDNQNWTTVGEFNISDWVEFTPKMLQLNFSEARYCKITHRTVNGGANASWAEVLFGLREVN